MSTTRKPSEELSDALIAAFSKEVSGEHNTVAFAQWMGTLGTALTEKSPYDPATYLPIYAEFKSEAKSDATKAPKEAIKTRKHEMLDLCNYLYRISLSLDLVEKLEKENAAIVSQREYQSFQEQVSRHSLLAEDKKKIDLEYVQESLQTYQKATQTDFKSDIRTTALTQLRDTLLKHDSEQKTLEDEILELESSLDSEEDVDRLEKQKSDLLDKIDRKKRELKSNLDLKREEKKDAEPTISPHFSRGKTVQALQRQYESLCHVIEQLTSELNRKKQTDAKKHTRKPSASLREEAALKLISESNALDRTNKDEIKKIIDNTTLGQYGYLTSWVGSWIGGWVGQSKTSWNALNAVAVKLHETWCRPDAKLNDDLSPKSIMQRVALLQANRNKLLEEQDAAERKRIKTAEVQLEQLQKEAEKLKTIQATFCLKANAIILQETKATQKKFKTEVTSRDENYDKLTSKVSAINIKKEIGLRQKRKQEATKELLESKNEIQRPLLSESTVTRKTKTIVVKPTTLQLQRAKKPSKSHRGWGLLGTILIGCGAIAACALSGPAGWIAGGIAGALGIASWIKGIYQYKKYSAAKKSQRVLTQRPISNASPTSRPSGRSNQDIQMSLRSNPVAIQNARRIGLNPEAAQGLAGGNLVYSLRDGIQLCFLGKGGVRLYKNGKNYKEFESIPNMTPGLNAIIPDEYRLKR